MVVDQSGNGFQYSPRKLKVTRGLGPSESRDANRDQRYVTDTVTDTVTTIHVLTLM